MLACMKEGLDIRGIYYWTLLDNFEWNAGYSIKFGLFAWDPTGKDGDRTPRGTIRLLVSRRRAGAGSLWRGGEGLSTREQADDW